MNDDIIPLSRRRLSIFDIFSTKQPESSLESVSQPVQFKRALKPLNIDLENGWNIWPVCDQINSERRFNGQPE